MLDMTYNRLEPILIYDGSHKLLFEHPELQLAKFTQLENGYDKTPCHRVWLKDGKGETLLALIVRSELLDKHWAAESKQDAQAVVDDLLLNLEVILREDIWAPGGVQFCFTPVGKQVGKLVTKVEQVSFSPDCVLVKAKDGSWGYDT